MADTTDSRRPRIGYLIGGDDLIGYTDEAVGIRTRGSTDLYHVRDRSLDNWVRLQIPRNYLRLEGKHNFANFNVLVNLITDSDQNPTTLGLLEKVLKPYKGRLLNPPAAVSKATRDRVALTLDGVEGLTVPKVMRFAGKERVALTAIEKARFPFPAILRSAGTHSGMIVGVVDSPEAVLRQIQPAETYFLTQYVDTQSPDGLYRKLRVFFVGERQIIRHFLVSDHWNVHASARDEYMTDKPALVAEECKVVEDGVGALPERTQDILRKIKARMRLDFFGADLALREDGSLVLFEANPTMNFFPFSTDPQFAPTGIALERAAEAFGLLLHPQGPPEKAAA